MQLFYNNNLNSDDKTFSFKKDESRHICKVLRKRKGDKILITNGNGYLFKGEIQSEGHKECKIKIIDVKFEKPKDFKIHIAIAPTKLNDRFEWFVEKATEIGINYITPIICKRSERKIIKEERFKKIIAAAGKQSLKTHFPVLEKTINFDEFIKKNIFSERYIAHCQNSFKYQLKNCISPKKNILVMIGPEGDFDPDEISQAEKYNFKSVNLGKARLRTETAAFVACHTIHLCNE